VPITENKLTPTARSRSVVESFFRRSITNMYSKGEAVRGSSTFEIMRQGYRRAVLLTTVTDVASTGLLLGLGTVLLL
jgi:hypothetical protein